MSNFIFALVLLTLALASAAIRKTYFYTPLHELKRQAERGKPLARQLYRAAAYGDSLRGLLWLVFAFTTAGGIVLLARSAPTSLSELVIIALLWVVFSWLPASKIGAIGTRLTTMVTPLLVWLLDRLDPLLRRAMRLAKKRYSAPHHTGLFEREDLVKLIDHQSTQKDSRITEEELGIAKRALGFADRHVRDVLTPRKQIKTIMASETLGPIVIDELHQSGQEYVLVKESPKGAIVGSLELKNLGLHSTGKVSDAMDTKVYYVHENDSLGDALHAFYATNHPLFVVVNSSEEYLGIISVEHILHELLGHIPGDDFDQYADLVAVAARHNKQPVVAKEPKTLHTDDELTVEVVE